MTRRLLFTVTCFAFTLIQARAQFTVDLFSAQMQVGSSSHNQLQNGFVNLLVPVKLNSGHIILGRLAYEHLQVANDSLSGKVQNISSPIGMNWKLSENNRLTTLFIPKFSGESIQFNHEIAQFGFYGFFQHQYASDLRYRVGIYYNREFFGNFFVPLLGIDWKINSHLSLFGTLPNSMKCMYTTSDGKYALGIAFRSLMRSYRLNLTDPNAFVRFNENQLKLVNEINIGDHWVIQADAGYFITQAPLLYQYGFRKERLSSDLYLPSKPFFMLNVGLVYRLPAN